MARASRAKQQVPEMLPQKKWLSKREAIAYMDMGHNQFEDLIKEGELSISYPFGATKQYFNVDEINKLFSRKVLYKATA